MEDIGSPAVEGSTSNIDGVFTLDGAGNDIWSTADNFHYAYQMVSGDCEIETRVTSLEDTDPWAKAGVMIRETLDTGSKHASVLVTPGNGVTFQQRATTGGTSIDSKAAGLSAPYWVKIKRTGDLFTGSRSPDGITWTAFNSATIPMAANVYFGLAACSHVTNLLTTATFDNVNVSIPEANAGADQTLVDFDANGTEWVTLDGTASTPGIGSIQSYVWTLGTTQVATGATPRILLDVGIHSLTLTVTNGTGATASAVVAITVQALAAPSVGTILSDLSDASPLSNGSLGSTATDSSYYAGRFNNVSRSPVFVFQLPDLGPFANPFVSASVSFDLIRISTTPAPAGNVDLYGLGKRTTPTVLASDYWADSSALDTSDATLLQDNILIPGSSSETTTSVDIATYLNAQYASGAGAGNHIFLRLSTDAAFANSQRYFVTSANGSAAAEDETISPKLNFTASFPHPDSDDDGMPDRWEMQNFKTLSKISTDDDDGDGQSNVAEFLAGTNPGNPASSFKVKSLDQATGGGFTLKWDTVNGRTYTVLRSVDLAPVSWTATTTPEAGTGGEMIHSIPTNAAITSFYRVSVTMP